MSTSTKDATSSPQSPACAAHGKAYTVVNVLLAAMISLAAFAVYELHSYSGKMLLKTTELRTAVIAREMLISADYITPTLGGEDQLRQPPMSYWLTALSANAFFSGARAGPHRLTRAVQFPPAFSAALAVFVAALFGSVLFGRQAGIVAGLALASTELPMRFAQLGYPDTILMLFCVAAACAWSHLISKSGGIISTLIAGIALGLALLTKAPLPIALMILVPAFIELIIRRKTLTFKNYLLAVVALLIAAGVAAPWYVAFEQRHPGAAKELFFNSAPASGTQTSPSSWAVTLAKMFIDCLPWMPFAIIGFIALFSIQSRFRKSLLPCDQHTRFFLLYLLTGAPVLFFCGMRQEQDMLALMPALALLTGALFARMNEPGGFTEERMAWCQLSLGVMVALLACAPLLWPSAIASLNALGSDPASRAADVLSALGSYSILLAIGILILSHFCARQWVNARGTSIAVVFAGFALLISAWNSLSAAENVRHLELWASIDRVNDTLESDFKDAVIFAPGIDESVPLFFTGRKPASIQRFNSELKPGSGPAIFFVRGNSLKNFAAANKLNATALPTDAQPAFSIVALPETNPLVEDLRKK